MMALTMTATVMFLALIGASLAYAETANFQYETEFLNRTDTRANNQTNPDGSVDSFIFLIFQYHYPNVTVALENSEPVKADPVGTFFELVFHDIARIFSPSVQIDVQDDVQTDVEEKLPDEPIRALTGPEQQALNRLKDKCDFEGGEGKALAFQGVYQIFLDHPIEWYALFENKDARELKSEECRALEHTQIIANQTIGSRVIEEEFGFTVTDQSKKSDFDYSVAGDLWQKRADEALEFAQTTLTESYGYGLTYDEQYQGDPVISTVQNAPSKAQQELAEHKQQESANIQAWTTACEAYWKASGHGTLALRSWDDHLKNGDCDTFLFDDRLELIPVQELIDAKVEAGDKR